MDIFGAAINALRPALDDDFVDRANYFYTPSALLIFALVISTRQWIGQPIECWVPAEFKYAWEEYTENYCYIQDTYWLPMGQSISLADAGSFEKRISYYQLVPFILGTQAVVFCAPFALWRLCNFRSGFNIDTVVSTARESALKQCRDEGPSDLALLAYFVKDVLVVAVLQLLFLETVLSTGGKLGSNMFPQLLRGVEWHESGAFPRVTLCEFTVRILGNVNRFSNKKPGKLASH